MDRIIEKQRDLEIYGNYDVVVCGGGIAGISAALAAARTGVKTLLIENSYLLGGLATSGLVAIYLPLCDGEGHQLSFGIAEELLRLSVVKGYETSEISYANAWLNGGTEEEKKKKRFEVQYNPHVFAILVEKLLAEAGVELLFGTMIAGAMVENDKVQALAIETRNGRYAITAKSFVDATGDAAVYRLANEPLAKFEFGNALTWWYYELVDGKNILRNRGARDIDSVNRKYKDGIDGLDARELTSFTTRGHALILEDFFKRGEASNTHALTTLSSIPQVRMTRRIYGEYEMSKEDNKKRFEDSVGMFADWTKRGPAYELPFSCLHDGKIKNLISAGRCISAKDDIWELTRVIPVCAVSGEAAGIAMAMTDDLTTFDVSKLQKELQQRGVKLHLSEVGL